MKRRGRQPLRRRRERPERRERAAGGAPQCIPYVALLASLRRAVAPLTLPELAGRLGVDQDAHAALRRQLEFLERQGVLFHQRRGRWAMHSRARIVVGRLSSPRSTFGFVTPEREPGPDLFISGRRLSGARHGDRVLARRIGSGREEAAGGGSEGEVMAILERRSPFIAGLYHGDERGGLVLPRDERVTEALQIENPRVPVVDGAVVWAEILSHGDRFRPARGRLIDVLGRPEDPGVVEVLVERTYELPREFPPEVEAEARAIASAGRGGVGSRTDYTADLVLTIDPATARDHDDAVGLRRVPGPGGERLRLFVHIADVTHYVAEGSAIDAEALRRGVSVYFPGYSIPMLPRELSSDLCSLRAGEDRLVQSVVIDFDSSGDVIESSYHDGVIRSGARLTYEQAAAALAGSDAGLPAEIVAMLREMDTLRRALRRRRMRRGSLDLNLPEIEVVVDAQGRPTAVRPVPHTAAHELVEEFMLAANEAVAVTLAGSARAAVYRIHEEPDPAGIDAVEETLSDMGLLARRTRGPVGRRFHELLRQFKGRPEEQAVSGMILRSLRLARYSHEPIGHFGLAAPIYTHFTSPIRRYPDLVVHRVLREVRRQRPARRAADEAIERLADLAEDCSRLERRAEEAERAMVACKEALYMARHVGEEHHGMVTGITAAAVFVTLETLGVEGIVPLRPSRREATGVRGSTRRGRSGGPDAAPRWRLGDRLRVRVSSVDAFRAKIFLKPLATG